MARHETSAERGDRQGQTPAPDEQLRKEALSREWTDLTIVQQTALARVEGIIDAALEFSNESYWLRRSRIAFLSGHRGTGKTTAMLSLRQRYRERAQMTRSDPIYWLRPIDMDPAPKGTNALAALLCRVEEVLTRKAGGRPDASSHSDRSPAMRAEPHGETLRPRTPQLDLLASRVVYGFSDPSADRAVHLEPELLATEVLDHERHRLHAHKRLNCVLTEVAEALDPMRRPAGKALFVLPIDDFDLDPERSVDLLQFLRTVTVPRLFVFALGDVDLLYSRFLAPARDGEDREIRANALRKILPASQVVRLPTLTPWTALSLHWAGAGASEDQTLRDRLDAAIQFRESVEPIGLGSAFFEGAVASGATGAGARPAPEPSERYQAAGMLHLGLRHVHDLWLRLGVHLAEAPAGPQAELNWLTETVRRSAAEDPDLDPADRVRLDRMTETVRTEHRFDFPDWLQVETTLGRRLTLYRDRHQELVDLGCTLTLHRMEPLTLTASGRRLSRPLGGGLIVLHDLMRGGHGTVTGAWSDNHRPKRGFTEWDTGRSGVVAVPWFQDTWRSFRQLDLFRLRWNAVLTAITSTQAGQSEYGDEDLALWAGKGAVWAGLRALGLGDDAENWTRPLEVATEAPPRKAGRPKKSADAGAAESGGVSWFDAQTQKLAAHVETVAKQLIDLEIRNQRDAKHGVLRRWLVNLLCMIAPECGIPWGLPGRREGSDLPDAILARVSGVFAEFPDTKAARVRAFAAGIAKEVRDTRARRFGPHVGTWLGVAMLNPRCLVYATERNRTGRTAGPISSRIPTEVDASVKGHSLAALLGPPASPEGRGKVDSLHLLTRSLNLATLLDDGKTAFESHFSFCPSADELLNALAREQRAGPDFGRRVDATEAQAVRARLEHLVNQPG
ncbi:hypothetical protein L6V77_26440 [Myxococcota bacterium]|nr:hypothetical protein [Myxococcota bacterium]